MFEWILEVDEDALGEDRGRIQIIVEYQMNLPSSSSSSSSSTSTSPRQQQQQQQQHRVSRRGRRHRQHSTSSSKDSILPGSSEYRSVENRITAHVDIQRDNTYAIVPVVKVRLSIAHLSLTSYLLTGLQAYLNEVRALCIYRFVFFVRTLQVDSLSMPSDNLTL